MALVQIASISLAPSSIYIKHARVVVHIGKFSLATIRRRVRGGVADLGVADIMHSLDFVTPDFTGAFTALFRVDGHHEYAAYTLTNQHFAGPEF